MKTVEHKLLSEPGKMVKLPEESISHANELLSMANSSKNMMDLLEKMEGLPYFKHMEYHMKVALATKADWIKKPRPERLTSTYRDKFYLQIGRYDLQNKYQELEEMIENIDKALERIESR
jgi:hypothetical protein